MGADERSQGHLTALPEESIEPAIAGANVYKGPRYRREDSTGPPISAFHTPVSNFQRSLGTPRIALVPCVPVCSKSRRNIGQSSVMESVREA